MESIVPPLKLAPDHFGLYVHIPFCVRKCSYCDFASQPICHDDDLPQRYLDALVKEAKLRSSRYSQPLHSIYIGGGTPTTLSGKQLKRLWLEVISLFSWSPEAEITIEANPGTINEDVLSALADIPVTRVSLGAQSVHPDELAALGRIHSFAQVEKSVSDLRSLGKAQINIDLMYGLPGQTPASWNNSLQKILSLSPDHISLYSLMLEEGTPLAKRVNSGELSLPGEEEAEAMESATEQALCEAGFRRYEVSNAAKPEKHSRHNLGYWLGHDYLGLGASATSTVNNVRWRNTEDAAGYISRMEAAGSAIEFAERLSSSTRLLERVMLGLRLRDGFDLKAAENDCGCMLMELAPKTFTALQDEKLLSLTGNNLRLTSAGFPLANTVVSRLMGMI